MIKAKHEKITAGIVALFSFFISLLFHEYNIALIKRSNHENKEENIRSMVFNETIFSIDNEYYLSPVINFEAGKGWKRSPAVSNGDYFRRVPGYSILYYLFIKPFGYPTGHKLLKYFQLILFSVSVYYLFTICWYITPRYFICTTMAVIYGTFPLFNGWLYFTLTEAITPALMIFYVAGLMKAYHQKNSHSKLSYYLLASGFAGCLVLTRPYTAIAGILLPGFLYYEYQNDKTQLLQFLKNTILTTAIPIVMIGIWSIRNYILTSEFVPLEKAFHPQSLDRMKPEFEGMLSFAKCWGEDGAYFNTYHQPMYIAAIKGDINDLYTDKVLHAWPSEVVNEFGYEKLKAIIKNHQLVLLEQKPYYDKNIAMPDSYLPHQLEVQQRYHELIKQYKRLHFFNYWIKAPLSYFKRMVLHSNTSQLYFFHEANRSNYVLNFMRYPLILIHVAMYLCLFFNLLFIKNGLNKFIFVFVPILFICFFTIVHREIEQRYMLPVIPIIFIGMQLTLFKVKELLGKFNATRAVKTY